MEHWYALKTVSGKEESKAELLKKKVSSDLWSSCRVLKKVKVFRSGGLLHLVEDVMFPGYLLVKTDVPSALLERLIQAGDFPQPIGTGKSDLERMIPLEPADLFFLQTVCGENLQRSMGITRIQLDQDNHIVHADGVLSGYLNQIVKLNLHKRFAVVEVELFHRKQQILFGLQLEQDRAG